MIKVLRRTALVLAVILLLLCGATVALMFRQTQTVANKFEPANVDCVVHETTNSGNTLGVGSKSSIKIQNTGNIDAYLRVRFVSYWVDAEGNIAPVASQMPTISYDTANWIADAANNTYYYKYPVAPEDNSETTNVVEDYTGELLTGPISLGTTTANNKTYYQVLEVFADAIQSIPAEAVTSSWKVTVTNGAITAVN